MRFYGEFNVNLCRRAGYEPQVNAERRSFEVVKMMVASRCSISFIPGLRLAHKLSGVSAVKLRPEARHKIAIMIALRHGERNHPAIKVFVEQMISTAAGVSTSEV